MLLYRVRSTRGQSAHSNSSEGSSCPAPRKGQPMSIAERRVTGRGAHSGSMVWVNDGVWWESTIHSELTSESGASNQSTRLICSPFLRRSAGKPLSFLWLQESERWNTWSHRISSTLNPKSQVHCRNKTHFNSQNSDQLVMATWLLHRSCDRHETWNTLDKLFEYDTFVSFKNE